MRVYLDANILAFLILDPASKGQKAEKLINGFISSETEMYISALAIDELMWVLLKNKKEHLLRETIHYLYEIPGVTILPVDSDVPLIALEYMERYSLKPRDAFHAAVMEKHNIEAIASDDADFDRIKNIKRIKV